MTQSTVTLSASDTEIQEALKVIEDTLASDGFVRDPKPPEASVWGSMASYSKFDSEGRVRLRPLVQLRDGRLQIVFSEGRVPGSRLSTDTKKTVQLLEAQLINRYGKKRVKVERTST